MATLALMHLQRNPTTTIGRGVATLGANIDWFWRKRGVHWLQTCRYGGHGADVKPKETENLNPYQRLVKERERFGKFNLTA